MSHHVKISPGVSVLTHVRWSMGQHGPSPWCNTDILNAAKVSYWLTSRVSKTLKCLLHNMPLKKRLLCTTLCAYLLDPWTSWWKYKILCERIKLSACWTFFDLLSAGQNNGSGVTFPQYLDIIARLWPESFRDSWKAECTVLFDI